MMADYRVYKVLSRKRPLTLPMIRQLQSALNIPAERLIKSTTAPRVA
jgi:HTH-type transcriptional regulator/antitoxin HigA